MRSQLLLVTTATAAILAAGPYMPARADSLTESSTLSFGGPQGSYDFPALARFDSANGTLTSATLTMSGTVDITYAPQVLLLLARPAFVPIGLFPPFGGYVTFQELPLGNSSITGGYQYSSLADGPNAVNVALQGSVNDLTAVTDGPDLTPSVSIGSDSNSTILDGMLEADLTFTYDATAAATQVPEPGSIALVATGLLSLGIRRRRPR